MSNRFTSRERIAMIVVAGVVAIAIAALALRRNASTVQMPAENATEAPTHVVVTDKPDSVKANMRKRKSKSRSSKKVKTASPRHPKPRDYFTSPENE